MECPDTTRPQLVEVVSSSREVTFRFDEDVTTNATLVGTASTPSGVVDLTTGGYVPGVQFDGPRVTVHLHSLNVGRCTISLQQVMDMHGNMAEPLEHDVAGVQWGSDCLSTQLCDGDWLLAGELQDHWRRGDQLACTLQGDAAAFRLNGGVAQVGVICGAALFLEEALLAAGLTQCAGGPYVLAVEVLCYTILYYTLLFSTLLYSTIL